MSKPTNDEMPQELVISIQRILEPQAEADPDILSVLAGFTPVDVLNQLFPDGAL